MKKLLFLVALFGLLTSIYSCSEKNDRYEKRNPRGYISYKNKEGKNKVIIGKNSGDTCLVFALPTEIKGLDVKLHYTENQPKFLYAPNSTASRNTASFKPENITTIFYITEPFPSLEGELEPCEVSFLIKMIGELPDVFILGTKETQR